ncbi:NAD(P)-dependent oxidoreductase [Rhizobium sp. 2YAF20]|uniref:NAD(P)-dependent oxidoreductase n=1 Tax=Rhizobium sp. 2YAF20 TaxID=3233027 RepID=UPI003F9CEEEC
MAHVALIGASGNVGSRILRELANRGHTVTAIARNVEKIENLKGVTKVAADVCDVEKLGDLLRGHAAVISAVKFVASDCHKLVAAVSISGVLRYIVVGGAGSLEVAPGQKLVDTQSFPEAFKAEANKGADFLAYLKEVEDLEWTFFSPSARFGPGERTGKFRLGSDQLLVVDGVSKISFEDYAVALVDELERPRHIRQRFTVGY